jgi:hypothetical protein
VNLKSELLWCGCAAKLGDNDTLQVIVRCLWVAMSRHLLKSVVVESKLLFLVESLATMTCKRLHRLEGS